MDIHHGIERLPDRHSLADLHRIRAGIRIGDILLYPQEVEGSGGPAIRWSKAVVTGIYPNLVSVTGPGNMTHSITYVEMWLTPKILNGLEKRLGLELPEKRLPAPWTREDEKALEEMYGQGMCWEEIGKKLNRTGEACRAKYRKIREGRT